MAISQLRYEGLMRVLRADTARYPYLISGGGAVRGADYNFLFFYPSIIIYKLRNCSAQ